MSGACNRHAVTTTWRAEQTELSQVSYDKVLVVAVITPIDSALRESVERRICSRLSSMGVSAVSSMAEFGASGLARMGEEETYLVLCGRGIDAVVTIALLDKEKEDRYGPAKGREFTPRYYYRRVWNYKYMMAEEQPGRQNDRFFWECILFDLFKLQPQCVLESKTFRMGDRLSDSIILNGMAERLTGDGFLKKSP